MKREGDVPGRGSFEQAVLKHMDTDGLDDRDIYSLVAKVEARYNEGESSKSAEDFVKSFGDDDYYDRGGRSDDREPL